MPFTYGGQLCEMTLAPFDRHWHWRYDADTTWWVNVSIQWSPLFCIHNQSSTFVWCTSLFLFHVRAPANLGRLIMISRPNIGPAKRHLARYKSCLNLALSWLAVPCTLGSPNWRVVTQLAATTKPIYCHREIGRAHV